MVSFTQIGPRDLQKHSKWPMFLQMHGSILPKMIVPLLAIGCWATLITCISHFKTYRERPISYANTLYHDRY